MPMTPEDAFQLKFSFPEEEKIKEYIRLKNYNSGVNFWSYYEDALEFAASPSSATKNPKLEKLSNIYPISSYASQKRELINSSSKRSLLLETKASRKTGEVIYLKFLSDKNASREGKFNYSHNSEKEETVSLDFMKYKTRRLGTKLELPITK